MRANRARRQTNACSRKRMQMKQFGFMGKMALTAAAALIMLPAAGMYGQAGLFQSQQPKGPWSNKSLSPDERADLVIAQMTLEEKIQLLHGMGWQTIMAQPESGPATRAISTLTPPSTFTP